MDGTYLRFYVIESQRHRHQLLYEWLLEAAKKAGIHGGSAFRAVAGFGRHGRLHEDHFFELQGQLPMEVVFVVDPAESDKLLAMIEAERLSLFYAKSPVVFGITGGNAASA
jgi:PII-like signaling protein